MPCYAPLGATLLPGGRLNFKKNIHVGKPLALPCGRCIGCRLERARQWAVRIMHESKMHSDNSFITLTYSDENLPPHNSLRKKDFQDFMKRLRSRIAPKCVRFFACGEYGEKLQRPHMHAVLFGFNFPDRKLFTVRKGNEVFKSSLLESLWPLGLSEIGSLTFDSAVYVANYATKKVTGEKAKSFYGKRIPEFLLMSRGGRSGPGGIGLSWIQRYSSDVFPSDEVIFNGVPSRPPRFYSEFAKKQSPDMFEGVQAKREAFANELEDLVLKRLDRTVQVSKGGNRHRLRVREVVAEAKASLKRRLL